MKLKLFWYFGLFRSVRGRVDDHGVERNWKMNRGYNRLNHGDANNHVEPARPNYHVRDFGPVVPSCRKSAEAWLIFISCNLASTLSEFSFLHKDNNKLASF